MKTKEFPLYTEIDAIAFFPVSNLSKNAILVTMKAKGPRNSYKR